MTDFMDSMRIMVAGRTRLWPVEYRIRKRYSRAEKKALKRDGLEIRRIWQDRPSFGVTMTGVAP